MRPSNKPMGEMTSDLHREQRTMYLSRLMVLSIHDVKRRKMPMPQFSAQVSAWNAMPCFTALKNGHACDLLKVQKRASGFCISRRIREKRNISWDQARYIAWNKERHTDRSAVVSSMRLGQEREVDPPSTGQFVHGVKCATPFWSSVYVFQSSTHIERRIFHGGLFSHNATNHQIFLSILRPDPGLHQGALTSL